MSSDSSEMPTQGGGRVLRSRQITVHNAHAHTPTRYAYLAQAHPEYESKKIRGREEERALLMP